VGVYPGEKVSSGVALSACAEADHHVDTRNLEARGRDPGILPTIASASGISRSAFSPSTKKWVMLGSRWCRNRFSTRRPRPGASPTLVNW